MRKSDQIEPVRWIPVKKSVLPSVLKFATICGGILRKPDWLRVIVGEIERFLDTGETCIIRSLRRLRGSLGRL